MKRILGYALLVMMCLASPLSAQDEESGGFLVDLLQDTLSGDSRYIKVTGLEGALSSRATIQQITVSDDDGVWLTISDAVLDWNRLALVRGRFSVNALTAGEINIARSPKPVPSTEPLPSPETTEFSLPELPVSVEISEISVAKLILGKDVLGIAAELKLAGKLTLADGALDSSISATRLDRPGDQIELTAKYANESKLITLDLAVIEDAGGLLSKVMKIPDSPSIRLTAKGEGPVSAFTADIALASNGVDRMAGTVSLKESQNAAGDAAGGIGFTADLGGDITPLLALEYQPFFGTNTALNLNGLRGTNGQLDISRFNLESEALALAGTLKVSAQGQLEQVLVSGRIAPPSGTDVVLPMSGPRTSIKAAMLSVTMDAAVDNTWQMATTIDGLSRPDLSLMRAEIKADGTLDQTSGMQVQGKLFAALKGLGFEDAALGTAIGETVTLDGGFITDGSGVLKLNGFSLNGADYSAKLDGELDGLDTGFQMHGSAKVKAEDIARFAGLAGYPISGAISAEVSGDGSPLGGAFDFDFKALGQDLKSGIAQIDPLISGETTIRLKAERGTGGLVIDMFRLTGNGVDASANGGVRSQGTELKFRAELDDLSRIATGAPGPVKLTGNLAQTGSVWAGEVLVNGTPLRPATVSSPNAPRIAVGTVALKASVDTAPKGPWDLDLSLDALTHPLLTVSRATVQANGTMDQTTQLQVDGSVDADVKGLALWDAAISQAVGSWVKLKTGFAVTGKNSLNLSQFALSGDGYTASVDGQLDLKDTAVLFDGKARAGMADLSRLSGLAGRAIKGAVTAQLDGSLSSKADVFDIDLNIRAQDLASGLARLDPLIAGETTLELKAKRDGDGIDINTFHLNGTALTANAKGGINTEGAELNFDAMLDDLNRITTTNSGPLKLVGDVIQKGDGWVGKARLSGPQTSFLEADGTVTRDGSADVDYTAKLDRIERFLSDISGTLTSEGSAKRDGTTWTIASTSSGPAGITANVAGTYEESAGTADLTATGQLQLGGINRFIQPNSIKGLAKYNLAIKGKPSIKAISGTVTTAGTSVVIPDATQTIKELGATVTLADGTAQVAVNATMRAGGGFKVNGPISMTAPFDARLTTDLQSIVLTDNISFDSSANGQLVFTGPLTGNGMLAGQIVFGETNINIAATSGSVGAAPIPSIQHLGETASQRATRKAAGLIETDDSSSGPVIGLDINLVAKNKVFARGRGLQAELGGDILVRGTTATVVPSGQIELIRGTFDILGSRLALTEGRVTLQGKLEPYLEFVATTSTTDGQATLTISGPLDAPEIEVTSVPERPSEEALAMLVFGNRFADLSPLRIAQLALQLAKLSGNGGGATDKARKGAGLDSLDLGTDGSGAGVLGAGGYIADNIYTDVTVNTQGQSELTLNLDVTDDLTLKGSVDNTGDTGIGIFFERDY